MLASAWVYILTNHPRHTTLYAGSTIDLPTRVWEHLTRQNPKSFTVRYNVTKLVYYEPFENIDDAVKREWFIKGKNRKWKEDLINKSNPEWRDLTLRLPQSSRAALRRGPLDRTGGFKRGRSQICPLSDSIRLIPYGQLCKTRLPTPNNRLKLSAAFL